MIERGSAMYYIPRSDGESVLCPRFRASSLLRVVDLMLKSVRVDPRHRSPRGRSCGLFDHLVSETRVPGGDREQHHKIRRKKNWSFLARYGCPEATVSRVYSKINPAP